MLRLDRLAAAVGSCGVPPVRVDWTPLAGTFPTSVTANDGTVVTITTSDPFGVADPAFQGLVWTNTLNSLDNPLLMAMEDAINGQGATISFGFSRPVRACFTLADVDGIDIPGSDTSWIDTVELIGTNAGAPVNLGAADMVTGTDNIFLTTNTVRGVSPTNQATGNVAVSFPAEIDELVIEHRDDSTNPGFQFIGIHDLSWC